MKVQCYTCSNKNKYFPSGCSEPCGDPKSNEVCSYYNEDVRNCPTCRELASKTDMVLIKDCYGIPYKFVCPKCVERTKAELQPYPFEYVEGNY